MIEALAPLTGPLNGAAKRTQDERARRTHIIPGTVLRQFRDRLDWSQNEAASRAGITRATVSDMERHATSGRFATRQKLLYAYCRALQLNPIATERAVRVPLQDAPPAVLPKAKPDYKPKALRRGAYPRIRHPHPIAWNIPRQVWVCTQGCGFTREKYPDELCPGVSYAA